MRVVVAVWGSAQDDVPAGGSASGGALVLSGTDLESYLAWSASTSDELAVDAADLLLTLEPVPTADRVVSTVR